MWSDECSSSEDDSGPVGTVVIRAEPGGLCMPYDRHQGFFLYNLAKLLDDSDELDLGFAIKWLPCMRNAFAINWAAFVEHYDNIKDVLAAYKMTRKQNKVRSARASWNRKLREWEFTMTSGPTIMWTTYTYKNEMFHPRCDYLQLPVSRR